MNLSNINVKTKLLPLNNVLHRHRLAVVTSYKKFTCCLQAPVAFAS